MASDGIDDRCRPRPKSAKPKTCLDTVGAEICRGGLCVRRKVAGFTGIVTILWYCDIVMWRASEGEGGRTKKFGY